MQEQYCQPFGRHLGIWIFESASPAFFEALWDFSNFSLKLSSSTRH